MPFRPLSHGEPEGPTSIDLGLLAIRLVTAIAFLYYQLAEHLCSLLAFAWERQGWSLVERFREFELPFAPLFAVGLTVLLTAAWLGVASGIFTRVSSLVLLAVTAFLLVGPEILPPTAESSSPLLSPGLGSQSLVLYLAVLLGLAIAGAGKVSLDHFLAGRKTGSGR